MRTGNYVEITDVQSTRSGKYITLKQRIFERSQNLPLRFYDYYVTVDPKCDCLCTWSHLVTQYIGPQYM